MGISFTIGSLPPPPDRGRPLFISSRLWLDADGARLYEWNDDRYVSIADPSVCVALRAQLPAPGEYFGGALLHGWVHADSSGLELRDLYWVMLGVTSSGSAVGWGPEIRVRSVPPEYDYAR